MKKDVIYVDIDDEITSITDKINTAKATLIALVLPKRCTVLQSSVNMKILKKTTEDIGKKLVLITSEAALLPIAGAAGIYVAKTLQSKPSVPKAPDQEEGIATINEAEDSPEIDPTKPIGELAGVMAVAAVVDDDAPIELGDEPDIKDAAAKPKKIKKDSKLKVPNFDKFRLRLVLIIAGIILLITGFVLANSVYNSVAVTITTHNNTIPVNMTATASPTAKAIDVNAKIITAEVKTINQNITKKFTATGDKNVGEKATGKITITNCESSSPITVPAGTAMTASGSGGLVFYSDKSVDVPGSGLFKGACLGNGKATVDVTASQSGSQYNLSARSYTVGGNLGMLTGSGGAMGGGTDKTVKVVSQSDCDTAKGELLNTKTDDYKNQLATQLSAAGLIPIKDTFVMVPGAKTSCNPDINQEASDSTASVELKLSMLGVNEAGLSQVVQSELAKQLQGGQSIFDTGVKTAQITIKEKKANGDVLFQIIGEARTGIKQDSAAIAKIIAGKKSGETYGYLKDQPGVTDVKLKYNPFWVSTNPTNVKRITVKFINNGS